MIGLAALTDDFSLPESLPSTLHDYFAEELFQAAAPSTQRGSCLLAIAPSLNSAIAEFLLGESAKEVIREGVRLGFLTERSGGIELHPLLRTFLETKNKEHEEVSETHVHGLARYVAQRGAWDDAFTLVIHSFSEAVFVDLLESGLRDMLAAARLATLERWLDLAYQKHLDAGIVDLAQAEIAFHQGERTKGETLALRGTRRFGDGHPLASRAFYIAGMSAHLDYHNERALRHCEAASARAKTLEDRRDATWGNLVVSLDLALPSASDLLSDLIALDDGSAVSEIRLAVARSMVAVRSTSLVGLEDVFSAGEHVLPRVTEPHMVSSFMSSRAYLMAAVGRYTEALSAAKRCEQYAVDVRLHLLFRTHDE